VVTSARISLAACVIWRGYQPNFTEIFDLSQLPITWANTRLRCVASITQILTWWLTLRVSARGLSGKENYGARIFRVLAGEHNENDSNYLSASGHWRSPGEQSYSYDNNSG